MKRTTDSTTALFEQLRPRLTALSCRIVGSRADAEDVVQDCFLKWQGVAQEALATPAAWLTTVVRHQSIDLLRRRVRDTAAAQAARELWPETAPALPDDGLLRRAGLADALARLLARLSPSERLALVLHEVFDCGHADIAAALGTTAVNARQYLARARRKLGVQDDRTAQEEALCRELVRRFQAALEGRDVPAMVLLLADAQPLALPPTPQPRLRAGACANDAAYRIAA